MVSSGENGPNAFDVEESRTPGNKVPQYIAALSVCLGSVAAGTVLGWTSNIDLITKKLNDIDITKSQSDTMASIATLGGLVICIPIGFYCDLIGRKLAMLSMIIPFSIGWLSIIFASNVPMIYIGRFLTGMAGGAFCVAAPMYTSEIAEKEIRGTLGSFFQLLLTVGILTSNVLGLYTDIKVFCIICFCIPLLFGVVFFLQPETPVYSLKKGREEDAKEALRRLRGSHYDVEAEIKEIKDDLENEKRINIPFTESFRKRATKKAFLISFSLMAFQQLSGVNAVIFYTSKIFKDAGVQSSVSPTIIVGIIQVVATFASSVVVDKFGRRVLLLCSDSLMAISSVALGVYFTLDQRHILNKDQITSIGSLPVISLCVFIIAFSVGFGPIPWMISSEVFPPEVKSAASSVAGAFNWFLAFVVTFSYGILCDWVGTDITFYIFAFISVSGVLFVLSVVPETKGKSLDQIQRELSGEQTQVNGIDNKAYS